MVLDAIAEAVKRFLLPGSLPFLLIALSLALGWWYLDERSSRRIRASLAALALGYWILATPFASGVLERALVNGYAPLREPVEVDAVVVLGGGASVYRAQVGQLSMLSEASALRALEGVRLYKLVDPRLIVVSGGPGRDGATPESLPLEAALKDHGVPENRILLESGSGDTHDQALLLRSIFEAREIRSFVLVTSPTHMRRADLTFRAVGLEGITSPALAATQKVRPDPEPGWVPNQESLRRSTVAAREILALVYYWLRGWI